MRPEVKVAFAGSRFKYFKNAHIGAWLVYKTVWNVLNELCEEYCADVAEERRRRRSLCTEEGLCSAYIEVSHGGNPASVDAIVAVVADQHPCVNGMLQFIPSSWSDVEELRKRNHEMVKYADVVVCIFVDAESPGTRSVMKLAKKLKKKVIAYFIDTENRKVKRIV